ncbi:hypothetical protein FHW36_101391 [Chitinophaga polysaccharea]|uniref:Uncharacterized protein n=1 Tax=Chitinophaga polysaccharea TaxID=1293035 RepID=A0A561Q278_9BACT|nr:hypothetical protein FHW36_101391 [Chitinophaga polysaccharea]
MHTAIKNSLLHTKTIAHHKVSVFLHVRDDGLLKGSAITAGNVRRVQLRDLWKQPA